MRLPLLSLTAIITVFVACNSRQNKQGGATDSTATAANDTVPVARCYEYIKGKDSVEMKAVYLGNAVSGTLTYKLAGKDSNNGTFSGDIKGTQLVAYYTFFSEGKQSVRQIVFRKEDRKLEEGYGNVYTRGDSVLFRSIDSLQYNNSITLKETPCK